MRLGGLQQVVHMYKMFEKMVVVLGTRNEDHRIQNVGEGTGWLTKAKGK